MATRAILQKLITNPEHLRDLAEEAKLSAFQHGCIIRTHETPNSSEAVTHTPFTLLPSPVPKAALLQAMEVQPHFNTLIDKIGQDPNFLEEALAGTIHADDFTAGLFDIYKRVLEEGGSQSNALCLMRSDYMLDQRPDGESSLKQIEINTFATGGFGAVSALPTVHRHVLRLVGLWEEGESLLDTKTEVMYDALAKAWELYGQHRAVVMFVTGELTGDRLTHRYIEKQLWNRNVPVIHREFEDVSSRGYLDGDRRFFIDGLEVAVVYYRHGYKPEHYSQQAWEARLMMERSRAVKCPDIATHLAGTKKVQEVLARPGVLERFFPDQPRVVEKIRATFAGHYTLDAGPEGDRTVAMALANPDDFVLKPQREGGGNNYFREDIIKILEPIKSHHSRAAYILMDRIHPRTEPNILLRRGLPLKLTSVCYEIGIFGAYVRHGGETVLSEVAGHALRTKSSEHDDGGVTLGVTVFDSPLVV